jgi:MFS family permease
LAERTLGVLARPGVRGPVLWGVLSRVPVNYLTIAVVLTVLERGGSFAAAGLVTAVCTLGSALFRPLVGRLADQRGLRAVLYGTALAHPLVVAPFVWAAGHDRPLELALAALVSATVPPTHAASRSLWSTLPLSDGERQALFAWEAVLGELLVIFGPLALALGQVFWSAATVLLGGAVLTAVATCGLARTGAVGSSGRRSGGSWLGPLRSGRLALMMAIIGALTIPIGLATLAIAAFLTERGEDAGHTSILYACWGVGSLLAALWYGRHTVSGGLERQFPWAVLAYAAGMALPALAFSEPSLGVLLAVGGAPISAIAVCQLALVRALAPAGTLVEAFTWLSTLTVLGSSLGQLLGGALAGPLGARGVFTLAAAVSTVLAAAVFAARRHLTLPTPATT